MKFSQVIVSDHKLLAYDHPQTSKMPLAAIAGEGIRKTIKFSARTLSQ